MHAGFHYNHFMQTTNIKIKSMNKKNMITKMSYHRQINQQTNPKTSIAQYK